MVLKDVRTSLSPSTLKAFAPRLDVVARGAKIRVVLKKGGEGSFRIPSWLNSLDLAGTEIEFISDKGRAFLTCRRIFGRRLRSSFSLNADCEEFRVVRGKEEFEGRLKLVLQEERGRIFLKTGVFTSDRAVVSLRGFIKPLDLNMKGRFSAEALKEQSPVELKGRVEFKGRLTAKGLSLLLRSKQLRVHKGVLKDVEAEFDRGRIRLKVADQARLELEGERIKIERVNASLLSGIFAFPVKDRSVWFTGEGSLAEKGLRLVLKAHGSASGRVHFSWIGDEKTVEASRFVYGPHILNLSLKIRKERILLKLEAETDDLASFYDKANRVYAYFTGEPMELPEIKGKGRLRVVLRGEGQDFAAEGDFQFPEAYVLGYPVFGAKGTWLAEGSDFYLQGSYSSDRGEGTFRGRLKRGEGRVDVVVKRGRVEDVLKALELDLSLEGTFSGLLHVDLGETMKAELVQAEADVLVFSTFLFKGVKGKASWDGRLLKLSFKGNYYSGVLDGSLWWDAVKEVGEMRVSLSGTDLHQSNEDFMGRLFVNLFGTFRGSSYRVKVLGRVKDFGYFEERKGEIAFEGVVKGKEKEGDFSFTGTLKNSGLLASGRAWGKLDEKTEGKFIINVVRGGELLPWEGSRFKGKVEGEFTAVEDVVDYKAKASFSGPSLSFFDYSQALEKFSAELEADGPFWKLKKLEGRLGGGEVKAKGWLRWKDYLIDEAEASLEVKDVALYPLKGVEGKVRGKIELRKKSGENPVINGTVFVLKGLWTREFEERIEFSSKQPGVVPDWVKSIWVDVNFYSQKNSWVDNSWGRFETRFDLNFVGPLLEPGIRGEIKLLKGYIIFGDRKFKIIDGSLYIPNPVEFDPYIDIKAEDFIKNYRVRFRAKGLLSSLQTHLSSSPPLPPQELLSLIALGESFRKTPSAEISYELGTASIISQKLAERVGKKAREFLGLTRLSVSPYLLSGSTEPIARLTVEKAITDKLSVVYSTNLSSYKQDIILMEYKLNPELYLILVRNEKGNFVFDIKYYPFVR